MKKHNKRLSKSKIQELAEQLQKEFDTKLPVTVLPNGDIVYKGYIVRQIASGNWGLFDVGYKELKDQFYLKSCALMAAKAYNNVHIEKYFEIKRLDNRYWANHCDLMIYKRNIKTAKEFERYIVLLNKLEDTEEKVKHYQEEISRMFKWSFV